MGIKIFFLIIFFAVMILIGWMTRRKAASVDGFVLGGRSAGPWLTAFGYGTSYFSAVVFVGYAGQFGFKYGISQPGQVSATRSSAPFWPGSFSDAEPAS